MKLRSISLLVSILAVALVFLAADRISDRRRHIENARGDASRFITSMNTGDERAVSAYLSAPRMDPAGLEAALIAHARNLQTTDFLTAPVTWWKEDGTRFVSFQGTGGTELTLFAEPGIEIWRVAAIRSRR